MENLAKRLLADIGTLEQVEQQEILKGVMPDLFEQKTDFSNAKTDTTKRTIEILAENNIQHAMELNDNMILPDDTFMAAVDESNQIKKSLGY